ncbi:MAG TPA: hypothetical protein VNF04_10115 [Stellaceae bacterium]|nr:hypothetical protein [Stellaceae bacterium]
MQWTLLAAAAAIAATLWLPGEAAERAPAGASNDTISFEQYRDWRNNFIDRRRGELAVQLAAGDLPAARRTRLEQVKAYYDWLAGLAPGDRDRRFRKRFDRIDTDHDGTMDRAERAAWRDQRRALYQHAGYQHAGTAAPAPAAAAK